MTRSTPSVPQPSATVVALREASGTLEALLVRRSAGLTTHGGAWVFPGGRVDAADYGPDADELAAARRAAAREAMEEAGLAVDPAQLVPFSHWTTPVERERRYATWFFAVAIDGREVRVDGGEIDAYRWVSPQAALIAQGAGELELPPPTYVTLLELGRYQSSPAALAALAARSPRRFEPRIHLVEGGACCIYAGDAGYEAGDVSAAGARHRLWLLPGGWRYENSGDDR